MLKDAYNFEFAYLNVIIYYIAIAALLLQLV